MKRIAIFVSSIFLVSLVSACFLLPGIIGSGDIVTRTYPYAGFVKVQAGSAFNVSIVKGASFDVRIDVDDNIVRYLRVDLFGDTLSIGLDPFNNYNSVTLDAHVTMPDVSYVILDGAATCHVNAGFPYMLEFTTVLSGASDLWIDNLSAGTLSSSLSGASRAAVSGSVQKIYIDASGASDTNVFGCPASLVDVRMSGASTTRTFVLDSGILSLSLSGASALYYKQFQGTLNVRECSGASSYRVIY